MKAAVIYAKGEMPQYVDIPEPTSHASDEEIVTVKAVAIKHLDKSRASGKHYSSQAPGETGRIIGGDGICLLANGSRVYAMSSVGMLAEKTIIDKDRIVPVPQELDDLTAAALPNAVIGSAMALRFKADIQPGDTVLINGATSFTGRMAIQIAKHYGAKRIIVTGRNKESLEQLIALGASESISLLQDDESLLAKLKSIHTQTPFDVIIDYLWGHTAELIMACLQGDGSFTNKIRYVSVGSISGDSIRLSAANLRSIDFQLSGSGLGAWSKKQVGMFFSEILPEMYALAVKGQLKTETVSIKLADIADLWDKEIPGGQRLVITI